ncbi:hypothetical protein NDI47_27010 [Microcoleus vaginatus GB1-A2]|uniref:hypothetical protein n=1 Tax=Microcoleus vaginatus TaxID=119532 RepID=UPI001686565E|nr:hypothetical protein [Microcoleus sp. FACHB-61]
MLPPAVVLWLAMQLPALGVLVVFALLVMLWVLVLAIQFLVVRAHLFLCVLAYYVGWHMRQRLAPLLFEDEEWLHGSESASVVVPVKSSTSAKRKASTKCTPEGFPVQSFRTLITNLSTIAKNRV